MIERVEFFEMCRDVAVLPNGVAGVKKTPPKLHVKFNGMTFYPVGYKLTYTKQGKPHHTAILHDLKAKSIHECDLLKVERMCDDGRTQTNTE